MLTISRKIYTTTYKNCVGFEATCFTCKTQSGSCSFYLRNECGIKDR